MTTQIFSVLGRYGGRTVIALNEVQELSAITPRFLKLLAYIFNTYPNMTFIFSGSMFGTIRTLLNPPSTSPLYGRPPAKIILKPFDRETSLRFLEKGFSELGVRMKIEELDGVVGRRLALYGNYVAARRIPHRKALDSTYMDGCKIVEDELEHFLEGRNKQGAIPRSPEGYSDKSPLERDKPQSRNKTGETRKRCNDKEYAG